MPREFKAPQAYTDEARPPIAMTPVKSTQVKAIGFDEASKTLAVTFAYGAGAIYHYPNIEKEIYNAFLASESAGTFFGKHIKALPFTKYAAEPAPEVVEPVSAA